MSTGVVVKGWGMGMDSISTEEITYQSLAEIFSNKYSIFTSIFKFPFPISNEIYFIGNKFQEHVQCSDQNR